MNVQGISFGSNAQAQPISGGGGDLKTRINNYKAKLTNDELNTEKVATGAGVLAVLGTTALLIYKGLSGKGTGEEGQKLVQTATNTVTNAVKKAAQNSDNTEAVQHTAQQTVQQATEQAIQKMKNTASNIAQNHREAAAQKALEAPIIAEQKANAAIESVKNGTATYQQAKNTAKQNLTHNQKKMVQNQLNNFNSQTKIAENQAAQHQKDLNKTVNNTSGKMNTAKQNASKVTKDTLESFNNKIDEQVAVAKDAVQQKQNIVDEAIKEGKQPTHKQQITLQRAKNELIETEKKAERAKAKAADNAQKTAKQDEAKLQGALEYLESTTPEERQIQAIKNAHQHERKLDREFRQKLDKPKYQRQMKELSRKENPALEKIANSDKDPITREIATEILALRQNA